MSSTDQSAQKPAFKAPKLKAMAGFTLIEVLVASAILALMALISWRGLDGMSKAQVALQTRSDANQTWQVGLAQWRTDLDNMVTLQNTPALDWDGRVLRITRQHSQDPQAGMQVVAWTLGNGQWTRWQSAPLTQRDAWAQAWTQPHAQQCSRSLGACHSQLANLLPPRRCVEQSAFKRGQHRWHQQFEQLSLFTGRHSLGDRFG